MRVDGKIGIIEKESCRNEGSNETRQIHGKRMMRGGRE